MDFELDPSDQNIPISLNYQELWIIPSDNSMDNNDEYFGWTSGLKIDEDKLGSSSINNPPAPQTSHKRKLSTTSDESVKVITISGYKPHVKDPLASLELDQKTSNDKKSIIQNGSSRMPSWQVEDMADLNADLEGSLTGLGGDLSNHSYNMNEAILSLSGSPSFKQEALSPNSSEAAVQQTKLNISRNINSINNPLRTNDGNNNHNMFNNTLQHLLGASTYTSLHNTIDGNMITSPQSSSQDSYNVTSSTFAEDCRFQYVLAAATSIATKVNEDTLTYLNQGQSYEIKLKKLGDLSTYRGKIFRSIIRICFHERRLQYMEREQMTSWQRSRPGDRILEIDVPLSYGLCDVVQPLSALNVVVFSWDPTKEVGVYIKVNCISTEFTPKKHGGEKGVPFRIQVETYQVSERIEISKRLHAAACQIKVFKLKGADRKHKQDREKIVKRPMLEQEKFQPSYECTVLNDIPLEAVVSSPLPESSSNTEIYSPETNNLAPSSTNQIDEVCLTKVDSEEFSTKAPNKSPVHNNEYNIDQLPPTANQSMTAHWLTINRFEKYLSTFQNFGGADMFRMARDDFIQICGHADGIRLYNALHSKAISPKLTLYVCRENSSVFNAVFLSTLNNNELLKKLSTLVGISHEQVRDIYMQGPQSIHIQLNNDVLTHIKEETMFVLKILQDNGTCIFVLKPMVK